MTTMPFGKYKGQPIADLPLDYIEWCLDNLELRPALASAFEARIAERHRPELQFPLRVDGKDIPLLRELLKAGRRTVAKVYHPDHGGDLQTMQRVNHIIDVIQQHAPGART